MLDWIKLTRADQVNNIKKRSFERPQVLFKHSSRCSVSSVVLKRLEKSGLIPDADFYFIDLLQNRAISDNIAEQFSVNHESPQVLLIKNGECVYEESHFGIDINELAEMVISFN